MEKNQKEKQLLYEWGIKNSRNYHFQKADRLRESYFIKRQNDSYIREYAFETFPEFMKELDSLWSGDENMEPVKKAIGVAVIKNKPVTDSANPELHEENKNNVKDELPAFIYNF